MENYAKAGMSTEYVPFAIEKLTCKTIYYTLLNHQHFPPPTAAERRLIERGFIFLKLSMFQYKHHNIMYTNKILYKMKKKQQPDCPYCNDID